MKIKTIPFGELLARLRTAAGLSITDLARLSGVSRPHLSRLESGDRQPALIVACRLARALGVGVQHFDPFAQNRSAESHKT